MSQPNGHAPLFPGPIAAKAFQTTLTGNPSSFPQRIQVVTNGTTPVNVFGSTNGFAGTLTGRVTIQALDSTASNISIVKGPNTTLFSVAKGTTQGAIVGTYFTATTFATSGTLQAVSSGSGNALVEVDFVFSNPALPNPQ